MLTNLSSWELCLVGILQATLETRIGSGALIRSHTIIYAGNVIGARFQTGHGVMIRELNRNRR